MLGIGGALIFIPILSYYIGVSNVGEESVPYLLANSYLVVFFASLASSYKQYKMNNLHLRAASKTSITAAITSLTVVYLVNQLLLSNSVNVKPIFKLFFLVILSFIVVKSFVSKRSASYAKKPAEVSSGRIYLAGNIVGFFSGITVRGGGSIKEHLIQNVYRP